MNLRPFQIFLLAIFAILAVGAVVLNLFNPSRSEEVNNYGNQVTVWGTFDRDEINRVFGEITDNDENFRVVEYRQVDLRTFNDTFVSAIADGQAPDLLMLPSSEFAAQRGRLLVIPYDTISERQFRDSYIDGAEIFAYSDGVYALPAFVDPLVQYWNRDMHADVGIARAPLTWEEVVGSYVPALTQTDNARNIIQSGVAMGEVRNVRNAKEIILALALQSGSQMIYEERNQYQVALNQTTSQQGLPPLDAAAQFFINFSNPNSTLYSWNRSQPTDRNAFVAGDVALYYGFGSERETIERQNPNLNFDMSIIPQGAGATMKRTYGEFYGLAIPKASTNIQGAYAAAQTLSNPSVNDALSTALELGSAQRAVVGAGSNDPYRQIILNQSLIARGWLDPDDSATDTIFQAMIEDITSGRSGVNASVSDAVQKIRLAF